MLGVASTDAEVELPPGAQVEVERRKELVLLLRGGIEPAHRARAAVGVPARGRLSG